MAAQLSRELTRQVSTAGAERSKKQSTAIPARGQFRAGRSGRGGSSSRSSVVVVRDVVEDGKEDV